MKRTALLVALLSLQALPAQNMRDPATASIEGVVLNIVNNQPVEGIRLRMAPTTGSPYPASEYEAIAPIVSDSNGTFAFRGLKAAVYRMVIDGNGYVRQQFGQKTFPGEGTPIELAAGQAVRGLTLRVTPTGTLSGRVQEKDSRLPVAGVPVQLMRVEYTFDGRRTLTASMSGQTNDRGEYRLYFVTPGRYYVRAGGMVVRGSAASIPTNPNQIRSEYSLTFYPGTSNPQDGVLIDVRPGADIGGMDFAVTGQALYGIRGRVVDAVSGQPPAAAGLTLFRRNDAGWERVDLPTNYRPSDGGFSYSGLIAGSYRIVVNARRTPQRFAGVRLINVAFRAAQNDPPGYAPAEALVDIAAADVEGVVIPVSSGVSLFGRLGLEGRAIQAADWQRIQVRMGPPDRSIFTSAQVSAMDPSGRGSLAFNDVAPGEYRISVSGLPQGFYVKQVRFGGRDALNTTFQISDREINSLDIVISSNIGAVSGTVRNERGDSMEGATVVLVPEHRDRTELFVRALSDRNGQFSLMNVPPGNYKAFAWDAIELYSWFDPEVLKQAESRGAAIRLVESSSQQVNLIAIP